MALLPHVLAAADALAYAHDLQVVHRDLKPNNVLVGAFGETIVVDWGLAKRLGIDDGAIEASDSPPPGESHDTQAGDVLGTPGYMAPEQATGRAVDARADVYALGALLQHVLTGQTPSPFRALRALAAVAEATPDLAAIVAKARAPRPGDRYTSARELADELRRFQSGQRVGAYHYSLPALLGRWLRKHRRAPMLTRDPTAALAWLKKHPHSARDWPEERRIAYDGRRWKCCASPGESVLGL